MVVFPGIEQYETEKTQDGIFSALRL